MRYMLLMQAPESMAVGSRETERQGEHADRGARPQGEDGPELEEVFEAMGRYNTELVDAGVLLAGEGLAPTAEGFAITKARPDAEATVTDGPFTEATEVVAGFWILEVGTREEAVRWAGRCPIGSGVRLEVRRIPEMSEFEGVAPAEVLDAETVLRSRIAEREAQR